MRLERLVPTGLFVFALTYYYLLSSKIFTWIYTSGDAGDWLSLLHWWYVPHTFGKPLIVLLLRFVSLFPGGDVFRATMALAIIPGAITVLFTYLIACKLTGRIVYGLAAALVLLGAAIFTSQTGVVEQYAFTAMFLTVAFWFYIRGNKVGTLAFLGLCTATHIIGAVFLLIWLIAHWGEKREWLRLSWVYVITGILPYGLILALMAHPETPKLVAGGLSVGAIIDYGFRNSTISSSLALLTFGERLVEAVQIGVVTLGLAVVPIIVGLKEWGRREKLVVGLSGFVLWFYMTAVYPSVWKWTAFVLPVVAVYAGVGLAKLRKWHAGVVICGAVALIVANGLMLNTDTLARRDSQASDYEQALMDLPDGSAVVIPRGGAYGFTMFYVMSKGKELIPLAQFNPYYVTDESDLVDNGYSDYLVWLRETYGVEGRNMYEIVQYTLDHGYNVYYGQPLSEVWKEIVAVENNELLGRILAVNHNPDLSADANWRNK